VPGGYAFLAPGAEWSLRNNSKANVTFHWLRKHYQKVEGLPVPESFVTHRDNATVIEMPGTEGAGRPPASSTWPTCATTCTSTS
jgi:(S)-ureidoglycine aminohydrolase